MLNEPLAIVYIRDPDRPEETRAETLQRLYGITPSQARLAELLATGCSLQHAAKTLGITEVSARQYLKLVFQKTATHRQAELVRKILQIPPAPKWTGTPRRRRETACTPACLAVYPDIHVRQVDAGTGPLPQARPLRK